MKILLISNGIYEYDGRLRELIKVCEEIGETVYITRISEENRKINDKHFPYPEKAGGYLSFVRFCLKKAESLTDIDVIFADNRKAIIPAWMIGNRYKKVSVIQDMRELYLYKNMTSLSGKVGCFLERAFVKRADILIVANKYRAEYVRENFDLRGTLLVYENLRRLEYRDTDITVYDKKYSDIFAGNKFSLISTSGVDISRTNDLLVKAMAELGEKFQLLMVGGGSEGDKGCIEEIIEKNGIANIILLDKVKEEELKYLLSKCQAGIVNYHMKDVNNLYCASGKIYEFLFEGLPVITTENPPLVDMCKTFQIGESDNNYVEAVRKVSGNYPRYVENVKKFVREVDIKDNNLQLAHAIEKYLEGKE